ncbi:serine/threonine protein kinase [Microvirga terrae]|uniref:Serine/threonine protein kinase n=1 Tax=Microvirga terrae TaxID=2740529 RepID=A0ABY5RR82_9HYPH|nr:MULTISPECIES: serine/threonine protein kinase [Microvirga]MBQ0821335.1 serine/threonine protein kinase [Microvirga sp. HBU67558]UVF19543.1 serine/threonine protein kinase [Microvirga terrae]
MSEAQTIHAGCVLVGEAGLLIRGPSGSGKSTLAREVVSLALRAGRFGRLVSDDRTRLEALHGRLLARPVDPLGGSIEVFGLGIVRQAFEPAAVIRLVVDLSEDPARYPDVEDGHVVLCGVMVPRIRMQAGAISADVAMGCLSGLRDTVVTL